MDQFTSMPDMNGEAEVHRYIAGLQKRVAKNDS